MKVYDVLSVMLDTQPIRVCNKNNDNNVLYEGIKAGCVCGFNNSNVQRILVEGEAIILEVDYQESNILNASEDELLSMYFDEEDYGMNLEDLEQNLNRLVSQLDDMPFDFDFMKK